MAVPAFNRRQGGRRVTLAACLLLALAVSARAERLPIRRYTTADGLAGDEVRHILQDSRGYLWVSTTSGLSRFDGGEFVNYPSETEFLDSAVRRTLEDAAGVLWVATNSGLYRYDPRPQASARFVRVYERWVSCLFEDANGRLWAGSGNQILRVETKQGVTAIASEEVVSRFGEHEIQVINDMAGDAEGSLWLATAWGVVRRLPDGRQIHYRAYPVPGPQVVDQDNVHWIFVDSAGLIWIGHGGPLLVLRPEPAEHADPKPTQTLTEMARRWTQPPGDDGRIVLPRQPGEVHHYGAEHGFAVPPAWGDIVRTRDGEVWIAGGATLSRFDGERFTSYSERHGLGGSSVKAVAEDRSGNLWIGTGDGGLLQIARSRFTSWSRAEGLAGVTVAGILETPEEGLIAVTRGRLSFPRTGAGLPTFNRWDGERFLSFRPKYPDETVYQGWGWGQLVARDREGGWWIPTGKGLVRYPPARRLADLNEARPSAVYDSASGLGGDDVFRLFQDSKGNIWISTFPNPHALTRWNPAADRFEVFTGERGFPDATPTAFAEDPSGVLWMGLYTGGLVRYASGRFISFGEDEGVPPGLVGALLAVGPDDLWMGSEGGGLARVRLVDERRLEITRYTMEDGLSSNRILSIVADEWHRLYLGTDRGIDRFDPATGTVESFTREDGLAGSFVLVSHRDREGALWFGTRAWGLSRLVPERHRPSPPPLVLVTALRINGRAHPLSDLGETEIAGLELDSGRNRVQIAYTGIDFQPGRRLLFRHRLEGLDAEWSPPSEQREVDYASLSPGRYRFAVRALAGGAEPGGSESTVAFNIPPPLWQRWWFLGLAALAIAAIAVVAHRVRVARVVQLERVRTRIATDLHDDLGSSLSRISILSEVAKRQLHEAPAEASGLLTQVGDTARGLIDATGDIVWSIDPRQDNLRSLIARLRKFASDILDTQGIRWTFEAPAESQEMGLTPDARRHLFLIMKEAINNVARHAEASSVAVSIRVENLSLVGTVRDDGRGFACHAVAPEEDVSTQGNGLRNMRARAEAVGGDLEVDSAPGRGTRVTAAIPLR